MEDSTNVKKKLSKKGLVIGGSVIVLLGAIVLASIMLIARDVGKTWEGFVLAYESQEDTEMMKYMFPGSVMKDAKNFIEEEGIDIMEVTEDVFKEQSDLGSYKITKKASVDKTWKKDIDTFFKSTNLEIKYDSVKIIWLKSKETKTRVLGYRVGNTWYVLPGVMEYIVETRQKEDILTGTKVKTALESVMSDGSVDESMKMYKDVSISMEELEYLPEIFQDALKKELQKKTLKVRHKEDGATGYAFKLTSASEVHVYISSDTSVDEWEVYPDVDSDYYAGLKAEPVNTNLSDEYRYVKLVSSKSPLLGYWQSDKAGMHIGYDVSGGGEGFTVYLQTQDIGCEVLHEYEKYSFSGGMGNIVASGNVEYNITKFDICVESKDTLKLVITDFQDNMGDIINAEYTFKKGKITKEDTSKYLGNWVSGGTIFDPYTYGTERELISCTECGCVHEKDYKEAESDCYHKDPFVSLFDGENLHYIFPQKEFYSTNDCANYNGEMYSVDGNTLYEEYYEHNGGSGSETYTLFRKDSEEDKVAAALNAYQEYVNRDEYLSENVNGVALFYLDGDNIPEAMVTDSIDKYRGYIMTYSNGKVESVSIECAYMVEIQERQGKLYIRDNMIFGDYGDSFYTLKDGKFKKGATFVFTASAEAVNGIGWYYHNDKEVDEDTYDSKLEKEQQNFGCETSSIIFMDSSWLEAYEVLKMEMDPEE